jgi:hypothetical protein
VAGVPSALWRRPVHVVRPRDALGIYRNPQKEFARFVRQGLMARLAPGYFALIPPERVASVPEWRPSLADAGWAIAAVDYGIDAVAMCGPTAARHHGLLPRVLALAHIAVPKQRPPLRIDAGEVRFTKRDVARLDLERVATQLGSGWITTLEQTALDLAARPNRWRIPSRDLGEALMAAVPRLDVDLILELGTAQHRRAAADRLLAMRV